MPEKYINNTLTGEKVFILKVQDIWFGLNRQVNLHILYIFEAIFNQMNEQKPYYIVMRDYYNTNQFLKEIYELLEKYRFIYRLLVS